MKKYNHLSENERELIFLYQSLGKSYRIIAKIMGRDRRTIAREILRNTALDKKTGKLEYSPSCAQALASQRRKEVKVGTRKLNEPSLSNFVIRKLGANWSPEQIAGRIKLKASGMSVSHETIYQFIYDKSHKKLKLWELLRKRHRRRQLFGCAKSRRVKQIPNRVFIEKRPAEANERLKVGHWETDNMEGLRKTTDCVSVCVDRKSCLVKLDKLVNQKSNEKRDSLVTQFGKLPNYLVKTITMDNGKENYQHQKAANTLGCKTYFCNPYHSWEKGTVENTIGLVRQYLPKKTDFAKISKAELNWIAWQLNNRPRKKLGYYTPSEFFYKETGWVT